MTTSGVTVYPCDRGMPTGMTRGWHHFEASPNGVVVCRYCGRKPSWPDSVTVPRGSLRLCAACVRTADDLIHNETDRDGYHPFVART
jgi:hypothetical protein